MRYFSIFSGIEAASVAWHPLGWECVGVAEVEKFPCAVLAHHYPNVPNLGDVTKFKEWKDVPAFDVLVGGSPCQSFSVAGLRKGLADPRGNLMLTYLAIAGKYRPEWILWENVPGVLSVDGGRAFGSFLGGLAELGYGFACRVLDAQHFGVPQRRRRVFVVGHLGDWRRAAAVLFERESLRGDPPPSRKAGERTPGGVAYCAGVSSVDARNKVDRGDSQHAERFTLHKPEDTVLAFSAKDHGADAGETSPTLRSMGHDGSHANGGGQVAIAFNIHPTGGQGAALEATETDLSTAISPVTHGKTTDRGTRIVTGAQAFESRFVRNGRGAPSDVVPPLKAQSGQSGKSGKGDAAPLVMAPTLTSANDPSRSPQSSEITAQVGSVHASTMQVRRITPTEAERLQGFPDGWTAIPFNGREVAADGPRYKALGNSMAVPCMAWLGRRIMLVEELTR